MVDSKCRVFVGLYLSRTEAIAEEDSSTICGNRTNSVEFGGRSLFICHIELVSLSIRVQRDDPDLLPLEYWANHCSGSYVCRSEPPYYLPLKGYEES